MKSEYQHRLGPVQRDILTQLSRWVIAVEKKEQDMGEALFGDDTVVDVSYKINGFYAAKSPKPHSGKETKPLEIDLHLHTHRCFVTFDRVACSARKGRSVGKGHVVDLRKNKGWLITCNKYISVFFISTCTSFFASYQ